MRMLVAVVVLALGSLAHADPAADANKAFKGFVDDVAAKKLPAQLDAFIGPGHDAETAVADVADVVAFVPAAKLKIVATHVAKSGTAAWIVAELAGARYRATYDKVATTPLRASAFLTLDAGTWHVRAAHWSGGAPNQPRAGGCGNMDMAYEPPPAIGKGAEAAAKVITDALAGAEYRTGRIQSEKIVAVLSDDKDALMFGSAPEERFTGGAAIKKIFKQWKVDLYAPKDHLRAGIAPGGDLAWVAGEITSDLQCTPYRALFVLQREKDAWKIVHQHFSESVGAP